MKERTVLIWFRNDLRIHDNEMLSRAGQRGEKIVPVYCFDPRYFTQTEFKTQKTGLLRARFVSESVQQLKDIFQSLQGNLIIKIGLPEEIIPQLAAEYKVDEVYHHREVAQQETHISSLVEDALWRLKINLRHFIGHTLFHKEDFPFPVKDIPNSFPVFRKTLERESFIRGCFETPAQLAFPEQLEDTPLPDLAALGYAQQEILSLPKKSAAVGGELEAHKHLEEYLKGPQEQLGISPWVSLGCISVHSLYFAVQQSALSKQKKERVLLGLWWKDYFRFMFKKYGNLLFKEPGFTGKPPAVAEPQQASFERWKEGRTPDKQVNTIMLQLKREGNIDYAQRVKAASYLIDELRVSWLYGAAYFEETLIDYNPSSNYGNWAHMAGVGSSIPNNRISNQ